MYNDRVSGAYVVAISQNYDRLEVVGLNTSGCVYIMCCENYVYEEFITIPYKSH